MRDYDDRPMAMEAEPVGQLGRLTKMIAELEHATDRLTERIGPVLSPPTPEPPTGMKDGERRTASELSDMLDRLHHRIVAIRILTDRVDL